MGLVSYLRHNVINFVTREFAAEEPVYVVFALALGFSFERDI